MSDPLRPDYSRLALLVVALLLPTATLIPLGGLWLWEHGYLLYWALGTCLAVIAAYLLQRRLLVSMPSPAATDADLSEPAGATWTPLQAEAWKDVVQLASTVDPGRLSSRDKVISLGLQTIECVAKRLHPERRDPLLQFTVPEALAVIERASLGLRTFVSGSLPLGDRITVAQLMWLYRWRGTLDLVEKGYGIWRIVRMLNPMTAATHELRERFSKQLYEMGREHMARRLAEVFVREVGRAAIDLYGGNLRVTAEQLGTQISASTRGDLQSIEERAAEPIRILVAGQMGAGKSSLVNALAGAVEAAVDALPTTQSFVAYRLTREGFPAALIIDSPGLTLPEGLDALIEQADDSDMVLWTVAANRAAREIDRAALAAIRAHFAAQPNRRRPPMLLLLTHVDMLRPFSEWSPPYDLAAATRPKAASIRAAMEAAGSDLDFTAADIIPVYAGAAAEPYNIDAVWGKIIELMPEAQRARLLRAISDIRSASAWSGIWTQAANAGRVITSTFLTSGRRDAR